MNTVFIIGIFLCFFYLFLLLNKKYQTISDMILAAWMFVFGIHLFSYYLYSLGYWETYPHLVGVHLPFPLLHGPMLYLYVLYSLRSDQHFSWKILVHFIPFLLTYLYLIDFFFFYSEEQKISVNHNEVNDFDSLISILLVGFIISGIAYPIISYRLLAKHHRLINENFAFEESISLNWLKYCIWGIGIIYIVAASIIILGEFINLTFVFNPDIIIYSTIILFIFFLGYYGIRHQGIFSNGLSHNSTIVEPKSVAEYKRSGLKVHEAALYHLELEKLMKSKKPYLEPKLTLKTLAEELNISVNHLSQIINQQEDKNFYDFVNGYRVEEFKRKALNPVNSHFNILAIAYDSGFNSKSSFNEVFKKIAGETPSQYMKREAISPGKNSR